MLTQAVLLVCVGTAQRDPSCVYGDVRRELGDEQE